MLIFEDLHLSGKQTQHTEVRPLLVLGQSLLYMYPRSEGNAFASFEVVFAKLHALSSHLGAPLEHVLWLLGENSANP